MSEICRVPVQTHRDCDIDILIRDDTEYDKLSTFPRATQSNLGGETQLSPKWALVTPGDWADDERRDANFRRMKSRRNRVYSDIIKKWKQAVLKSDVPKPRSFHPQTLAGQALSTNERKWSLLERANMRPGRRSWEHVYAGLSDMISPAARSSWRKLLFQHQLRRLAEIPMAVLLKQGIQRLNRRVFEASLHLSPLLVARDIIEGMCMEIPLETSRPPTLGDANGAPSSLGGSCKLGALDEVTSYSTMTNPTLLPRVHSRHGPIQVPERGFHLVDLHAMVRNHVQWNRYLSKVEPCFRVSDNRDEVLLGLVHALGGRLLCSSQLDIRATLRGVPRGSPILSPPPRLLDQHVCRSPSMLRAGATAQVGLYEVDCLDELHRISIAVKTTTLRTARHVENGHYFNKSQVQRDEHANEGTPAALIRLAYPFHATQGRLGGETCLPDTSTTEPALSSFIEANYGATAEDVVEFARSLVEMTSAGGEECKDSKSSESFIPIVGFSLDLGTVCWKDAVKEAAQPVGPMHTSPEYGAHGQAVASVSLIRDIEVVILFAVEVARRMADVMAEAASIKAGKKSNMYGKDCEATSTFSSLPAFSFRRLHLTGLGSGGAREEPLSALEAVLSRHLSTAGFNNLCMTHGAGKPVVVSADATEHLVAQGVWSTIASIIGRKDVTPSDALMAPVGQYNSTDVDRSCTGKHSAIEEEANRPGTSVMYYIDDGCYGSLSGALLRGEPMQPVALSHVRRVTDIPPIIRAVGTNSQQSEEQISSSVPSADYNGTSTTHLPCTVWGPTCDGLDCVSRVASLPPNLKPGDDWLFFPERGMRASSDTTGFNGLVPLDAFYCVRPALVKNA